MTNMPQPSAVWALRQPVESAKSHSPGSRGAGKPGWAATRCCLGTKALKAKARVISRGSTILAIWST